MMLLDDESGLIGKIMVVWLLIGVLIIVALIDTGSIMLTRFRMSDAAVTAAQTAVVSFESTRDQEVACEAARRSIEADEAGAELGKGFCRVDETSGRVTITIRRDAWAVLASRLSFTKDQTAVEVKEFAEPGEL